MTDQENSHIERSKFVVRINETADESGQTDFVWERLGPRTPTSHERRLMLLLNVKKPRRVGARLFGAGGRGGIARNGPTGRLVCAVPATSLLRKRSEGKTATDCWSNVAVVEIGDTGAMRNGDCQTAAHIGTRNSGKTVQTLGEVIIHVEGPLVEGARAGTAETGRGRAG